MIFYKLWRIGLDLTFVNYMYMVRGANVVIDENDVSCKDNFCLDAFAFDPTIDPEEGLLVPIRDIPTTDIPAQSSQLQ